MKHATTIFRRLKFYSRITLLILSVLAITNAGAQISLTATAGTTGPSTYTTLKGAFDAINAGTHQGIITISITGNTTETATAVLNSSGSGSSSYTKVIIKPGTATTPTVSGSIGTAIVKLAGADNVLIYGSNTPGGSTRDLTFQNNSTNSSSAVIWIASASATNGATGDTIKNCNIKGSGGANNAACVIAGSGTTLGNQAQSANSSNAIVNNSLSAAQNGIYIYGATAMDNGWLIDANTIGSTVAAAKLGYRGICMLSTQNYNISNNVIRGVYINDYYDVMGIMIADAQLDGNIFNNRISDIKNDVDFGSCGIYLGASSTASNIGVYNNFIWDIASYGYNGFTVDDNGYGIVVDDGGGYRVQFNTVWLNTNQVLSGGNRAACMLVTSNVSATSSINMRNNIFSNTQTVGNANSRYAFINVAANNVFAADNYNDYYATSGKLACKGSNATNCTTMAQLQTTMGANGNSVSIAPVFTSSTDLHLPYASNTTLDNLGISIAGITTDIDADPRATSPDMGADEFMNCLPVTIITQPTAAPICAGNNTSFTVAATNGNSIQWQVNTGTGFTNITNGGVYSGATAGTLTITGATASMNGYTYKALISSGASCPQTSSSVITLVVNPLPSVTVSSSGSTTFCTGGTDTLSVPTGTNLTYQWKNGSGNIPGATNASYVTTATGNYFVTVTNTATGCSATSATTIITVGSGPVANITPSGSVSICQGTNTTLSAGTSAGVTYQWKLNGTNIPGATANTYTTSVAGNYTVVVSTSSTCNTTSAPTSVNVNSLPTATASAAGSTAICQGSTVTLNANNGSGLSYQWLLNNGIISGATLNNYTVNSAGNYKVIVTNTTTTCKDTSSAIAITVNPLPTATITPTTLPAICQGDSITVTANSGAGLTYQWRLNGIDIAGATNISFKAYATGNYTVMVTNSNGCQKVSTPVALVVNPVPPAHITYNSPLSFCEGGAVVLNGYPGSNLNYQWIKDGVNMTGFTSISNTIDRSGTYTIRVTNQYGCIATSQPVTVTVFAPPVPVISANNDILSTGNYSSYIWYVNNHVIPGAVNGTHTVHENGGYKVKVTDANGCTGESAVFFFNSLAVAGISANDESIRVYPNPATSYITVENRSSKLMLKSVSVINSIGAIVYDQEIDGTTGTIPTENLASGVYYIRIQTNAGVNLRQVVIEK